MKLEDIITEEFEKNLEVENWNRNDNKTSKSSSNDELEDIKKRLENLL